MNFKSMEGAMTVTVFTKPHCPQCMATTRQMKRQGLQFETVNLAENPETLKQLINAGYKQSPIVITPDGSWSGYRPDLIKELGDGSSMNASAAASSSVPQATSNESRKQEVLAQQ